jgi:methyl-accepting chemotaxis protein
MRQFGIKGKINLGFAVLFLMLLLCGAISLYELTRSAVSDSPTKDGSALSRQLHQLEEHTTYAMTELSEEQYGELRRHLVLADSLAAELRDNALRVEQSSYRSIVPGIIAILAGLVLILLFAYFINYFFVNPLLKITQAVNNTVEFGSPFKVNVESNDEMGKLKEAISQLALQAKKSAKAEAEAPPFSSKKA